MYNGVKQTHTPSALRWPLINANRSTTSEQEGNDELNRKERRLKEYVLVL